MKYRPHRGSLTESMVEVVEVSDRAGLLKHLGDGLREWGYQLDADDLKIAPYRRDDRVGWDTHIVTIRNKKTKHGHWYFGEEMGPEYFGAIGFTDSNG